MKRQNNLKLGLSGFLWSYKENYDFCFTFELVNCDVEVRLWVFSFFLMLWLMLSGMNGYTFFIMVYKFR